MPIRYNLRNIRTLLTEGFKPNELRVFCFDEPELRPVHDQLAEESGKAKIVELLIEHANQKLLFEILLAWAKEHNPNRFKDHQPYYDVVTAGATLSEDGWPIADSEILSPPWAQFDPSFLEQLDEPEGKVDLRSKFYIERRDDALLSSRVVRGRSITIIRAPRQTDKSSLLARGLQHARQNGVKVVRLDLQEELGEAELHILDIFLRALAELVAEQSGLANMGRTWAGTLPPKRKLTRFMQNYVLPTCDGPLILAIDEADKLFQTNFYNRCVAK